MLHTKIARRLMLALTVMGLSFGASMLGASVAHAGLPEECEWDSGSCSDCGEDSCGALGEGTVESLAINGGADCWIECSGDWRFGVWDLTDCYYCELWN